MRHLIKSLIITLAAAYITYTLIPAIDFGVDPKNILLFVGGLWIISQVINPIFSIVLLPINILTFGLLSFVINVAFVFALLNYLPGFIISAYSFPGAVVYGVILPPMDFSQIATIMVVALSITIIQKILHIIFE